MEDDRFRDPWAGHDPQMESVVRLDEKRLGLRLKLSSGERMMMPLGQMSFHMRLDRVRAQPRKASPPTD